MDDFKINRGFHGGRFRIRAAGVALGAVLALAAVSVDGAGPRRPMRFEAVTAEDGLSQVSVLAVAQDRDGFLWFGTEDGLNRYDGRTVEVFKNDPSDSDSLPNDTVWALTPDGDGGLWVGTFGGGLCRWDPETEAFRMVLGPEDLGNGNVRSLARGDDGTVWIGTIDSGLFHYDPATDDIFAFRHDPDDSSSLSDDAVFAVLEDRDGSVWVATDGGLSRLEPGSAVFEVFRNDPEAESSLSDDRARFLFEEKNGDLWVGTRGGLNRFRPATRDFDVFRHDDDDPTSLSHDRVRAICEDRAGHLWVGTAVGLNLYHRIRGDFHHYRHDPAVTTSLSDDYIMSIFEDRGGALWVGTRTGWVNRWNPTTWSFGHEQAAPAETNRLSSHDVTAFVEDRSGGLWIGTFGGGLNHLDRATGEYRHFRNDENDPRSIPSDRVMALAAGPRGGLWIGTYSDGIAFLGPDRRAFTSIRHDPSTEDGLSSDRIASLLVDRSGNLWAGTFGGGLNLIDPESGKVRVHRHDPASSGGLTSNKVICLAQDGSGGIWVGTDGGGLNLLDPASGAFSSFVREEGGSGGLGSDDIFAVHVDEDDVVWVGTRGGGLSRLTRTNDMVGPGIEIVTYTERDGLANDVVYGIASDRKGGVWVSTNRGLSRLDKETGEIRNFSEADGLQAAEFHIGSSYQSSSGELFFGGVNGFNAFVPEELQRNESVPPVVLTGFFKFNQPAETDAPLSRLDRVDLGYRDDVVSFEVAALDFSAPDRNRYRFKLEGFNDQWIDQGARNRVTYTDLDAGRYVLRAQAANSDGVWNEEGLSLEIRVEPPPWASWWALTLYVLAVAGLVGAVLGVQVRKLKREQLFSSRLVEEVDARTRELAEKNTQLQKANERFRQASLTDSLTGLWNRRYFFEHVMDEVALVLRRYGDGRFGDRSENNSGLVFLMIDLDNFKKINDTEGHPAGDEVLLQVRDSLKEACRDSDILIRWGGDEFLVVARDTSLSRAETIAERIRIGVGERPVELLNGHVVKITCTIGFACFPFLPSLPELCPWDDVLSLADSALYAAKNSGRGAWLGLVTTGRVPTQAILKQLRSKPESLISQGYLEVRTSLEQIDGAAWN